MRGPARRALRGLGRLALRRDARQDALHEWRRRLGSEPPLPDGAIQEVLFVCYGNVCRSPYAAALLAARRPGLGVHSAGLEAGEGRAAEPTARRVAAGRGVSLEPHRAHRLAAPDLQRADLVLVMEGRHVDAVLRAWPEARPKLRLLGDYRAAAPFRIPDPWGESDEVFAAVFARIEAAVARLAALLEERTS